MPSLQLTSVALLQGNNNRCVKIVNAGIHLFLKKMFLIDFSVLMHTQEHARFLAPLLLRGFRWETVFW